MERNQKSLKELDKEIERVSRKRMKLIGKHWSEQMDLKNKLSVKQLELLAKLNKQEVELTQERLNKFRELKNL